MEIDYSHIHRELVEKSKAGNEQAQYQLYQLYAKAMYNICLRMMHNREEAEDMLQDAFIDAFQKIDSFQYHSTFGAWLKRIVINKCINELKRKRLLHEEWNDDLITIEDEVDEDIETTHLTVEKIKQAMEELPEGYRVVFSLYAIEGYDHQEIAAILNIDLSTSKSQYHRAKKKIIELINTRHEQA